MLAALWLDENSFFNYSSFNNHKIYEVEFWLNVLKEKSAAHGRVHMWIRPRWLFSCSDPNVNRFYLLSLLVVLRNPNLAQCVPSWYYASGPPLLNLMYATFLQNLLASLYLRQRISPLLLSVSELRRLESVQRVHCVSRRLKDHPGLFILSSHRPARGMAIYFLCHIYWFGLFALTGCKKQQERQYCNKRLPAHSPSLPSVCIPLLQSVDPGQQFTWEHSNLEVNKPKNRYANVIAYDHSRVILTPVDGERNLFRRLTGLQFKPFALYFPLLV